MFCKNLTIVENQDVVVCIVTGYGLDNTRNVVEFPPGTRKFSCLSVLEPTQLAV
jgi:hypothetical protein